MPPRFYNYPEARLTLTKDINEAMGVLGQSGEYDQASCLGELENSLESMMDGLSYAFDLITLSAQMKDSADELAVNATLAINASSQVKELAEDRQHALAQAALCPTSVLVNTYAQKIAALADRAAELLSVINNRVGWRAPRQ